MGIKYNTPDGGYGEIEASDIAEIIESGTHENEATLVTVTGRVIVTVSPLERIRREVFSAKQRPSERKQITGASPRRA